MRRLPPAVLAAILLSVPSARAQGLPTIEKVASAGKPLTFVRIVGLDIDCRPVEPATINLLEGPSHGRVTVENGREFPRFPSSNPRSKCAPRKLPSQNLVYRAEEGATGDDAFVIEVVDRSGNPRRARYHVTIR